MAPIKFNGKMPNAELQLPSNVRDRDVQSVVKDVRSKAEKIKLPSGILCYLWRSV